MTAPDPRGLVTRRRALALGGVALGGATLSGMAVVGAQEDDETGDDDEGQNGDDARQYRVTVGNLTSGQPFTPPAVAAHRANVELFAVGEPASDAVRQLAENGNLSPLLETLAQENHVRDVAVGQDPLVPEADPGETGRPAYATVHLSTDASASYLSFASMLIATNDGLVGLDTVPLPERVNESRTYYANGYDIGTERNTERFDDLVPAAQSLIQGGDPSGGTTESDPGLATDFVIHPHPGLHGEGDLDPATYGWHEPAGLVQVERLAGLQETFSATLSGDNEVPPVETDGTGEAHFELTGDGEALEFELSVSDIDDVVAAHIHCGPIDANGPVGVTLFSGGPTAPDGVLADGTITEPDSENDCGWETIDDVVAAMRGDHTYVNVHTQANPAGEIRGQVH